MKADFPPEVRRFILTSVPSVPFMEALLLLRSRSQPSWNAPDLAHRLYLPERQGAELLDALRDAGIAVEREGSSFAYGPTPELDALLGHVEEAYSTNLVAVTDLIHSRVDKRAQQFADAFRLRKDNN
ncbi:hypothetical protein [Ramlibacter albus]|uniref:Uncharacterized protein n=1 Tax=Ramlibacter albus TaxID=2079448 RepID=A0A923M7F4_9BURK|nr:hypothetical protein [Ramlibacter albus]MBC5764184.1 hypothetical protein [Ramlibacter albus]